MQPHPHRAKSACLFEELFSIPIERDPFWSPYSLNSRQGFWKVFWAHDTWGAIYGERLVLVADDGGLWERDIGDPRDINRRMHPVWMEDGQLVITATKTLIVDEELPILISATTHEIEAGTAPLVRSPKTARYGVQICAVPLDARLRETAGEACRVVER